MAIVTVSENDCLSSIAFEHGFFWPMLWGLGENEALRRKRESPFVLAPGDEVFLPELRSKTVSGATEKRHRFKRKGVPAKLKVIIRLHDEPVSNAPYVLDANGTKVEGTTDGDGRVEAKLPPNASEGLLTVEHESGALTYDLKFRHLNPVTEDDGVQSRLRNLGYYDGTLDGRIETRTVEALKRFQKDQGLTESGQADETTRQKLKAAHHS